jgi:hypothetical protein
MAAATQTQPDWDQLAKVLGISVAAAHEKVAADQEKEQASSGIEVPIADIVKGMISSAGEAPSQTQLREGAEKTLGYTSAEWAKLSPEDKAKAVNDYVTDPNSPLMSPATQKETTDAVKAGGAKSTLPSPEKAAKGDPATASESPYETLANSLADQYLQEQAAVAAIPTGTPGNAGVAQLATALGGQGLAPTKAETGVMGTVDPTAGGLTQAINTQGETAAEGAINMANTIGETGVANQETLEAAPWQQLLSELASETAYKAATQGASAFGLTAKNTPAFLAPILNNLGLSASAAEGIAAPGSKATSPTKAAKGATTTGAASKGSTANDGTETDNASSSGNN